MSKIDLQYIFEEISKINDLNEIEHIDSHIKKCKKDIKIKLLKDKFMLKFEDYNLIEFYINPMYYKIGIKNKDNNKDEFIEMEFINGLEIKQNYGTLKIILNNIVIIYYNNIYVNDIPDMVYYNNRSGGSTKYNYNVILKYINIFLYLYNEIINEKLYS